jgi:hypothetical protein
MWVSTLWPVKQLTTMLWLEQILRGRGYGACREQSSAVVCASSPSQGGFVVWPGTTRGRRRTHGGCPTSGVAGPPEPGFGTFVPVPGGGSGEGSD